MPVKLRIEVTSYQPCGGPCGREWKRATTHHLLEEGTQPREIMQLEINEDF